ncbi:MAG: lamin tail domain-containing protein [Saprospiraceae bacterium]
MRYYDLFFPLLLVLTLQSSSLFSQITINEVLADNGTTLSDDQGDFDDWIEIYNSGATAVDLAGYFISDDPLDDQLWQIPSSNPQVTTVPANGYLLLWADKDTGDGENHINLKLGASGETLTLTAPNGTTVDQVVFGAQNTDISYGRTLNGGSVFQLFTSPTPNGSNEVMSTPTFQSSVSRVVNQESDDAIEYGYTNKGVNIDHFGMLMTETFNTQKIGVRFQNIPIPSGATITGAYIQFTCKDPDYSSGPSNLNVRAQTTSAAPFEEIDANLSDRPVTSTSVNWRPEEWTLENLAGPDERTADLSSIIQEVVNQGSWQAGYNLAFIIDGTGQRSAENFTSGTGPSLKITYEAPIPTTPISNISINEVSASGTAYEDENGGKSDWIELYNSNDFPVSVGGLYLSDKATDLTKWQIGSATPIPARGFLTIFADGEPHLGGFHADFKIGSGGETITLVQALGNDLVILDQVDSGEIPFKTSAGRSTEGATDWVLFGTQTPNAPNDGTLSWLETPEFSLNHGAYNSPQSLTLSHPETGVTIYYTTDSSDPDNGSTVYTGPIPVFETTAIRARAYKSGHVPSQIETKSYLFDASATLPVVMITTDPDNLYDDEIGIYTVGTNGLNAGFCSDDIPVNYWQDWERPAHITFFETDGEEKFAVEAGIKISGNCSRRNALKSLNIYLRGNTYGDGDIDYKLFPNRDYKKYKRLRLRNSGQDFKHTMLRDGTNQQMLAEVTDVEYQSYRPTIVYINGEYFGIQNFRDLYGDEYFDGLFDVPEEELDLVKNPRIYTDIKKGSDVHYQALYDYVLANDLSDPASFDYFKTQFDIENLIDYWISMIYLSSSDWPANNLQIWRPKASDGKWRYMYADSDASTNIFGIGSANSYDKDTFGKILDPNQRGWPYDSRATLFIRKLLENDEFKDEFIQRTCSFMELILSEERAHSFIDASVAAIDTEIDDHVQRWAFDTPYLQNRSDWQAKVRRYTKFFEERPSYFYDNMESNFNLDNQFELTFGYDANTNGEVLLHWKEMSIPFNYTGTYYTNMPIRIQAVADPGYEFQYWLETGDTNEEIDFVAYNNRTLTPIFEAVADVCDPTSPNFQDSDNDGVCDNDDQCPGFDDNIDTNNNGVPDDCENCIDNDNDGVCVDDDCDDNNPNIPATPGTSCDDANLTTINDVIQADGCTCEGSVVSTDPCEDLTITSTNGQIVISGLDGAAHAGIQIFTSDWDRAFRCSSDCEAQTQIVPLPDDTYRVKISLYDENYNEICRINENYTVTNSGGPCSNAGGDADGDGVCATDDCDDNNPNVPATPGTSCDDGDSNTSSDVILADGCSCAGTPITAANYCDAEGDFPWHEWISNVTFNQINNASGKSKYSDFTDISTPIQRGVTYDITLETGFSYETFDQHWGVWIDFNSDKVFASSELVFSGIANRPPNGTDNFRVIGQATMPNFPFTQGSTRMRVVMSREETPTPCGTHSFGEVEDYTVNFSAPPVPFSVFARDKNKLWLSPNPANFYTLVHLPENYTTEELKVYNSNGTLIETISDLPEDTRTFELPVEHLKVGLYILRAESKGKQSQTARMVIMRN